MVDNQIEATTQQLAAIVGADGVYPREPLSRHTTFKVGGPVDWLVEPKSVEQIAQIIDYCRSNSIPWRVIGAGSNILVHDEGLPGLVIKLGERFSGITVEGDRIIAEAGATNRAIAESARDAGLSGYEFASGIPGTVGGAAYMNAGAYDGEFKDVAESVSCLNSAGQLVELSADEAHWSYRHSRMMDEGLIVLAVTLKLHRGNVDEITHSMNDLQERRESKQPLEMPSAGSTFKRPEGYYAGQLIDEAGLRGHRLGGAQVSPKHCGFIVNADNATAQDIYDLIFHVQDSVQQNADVTLLPEVRLWGFDK